MASIAIPEKKSSARMREIHEIGDFHEISRSCGLGF
jgi:hypothetical protein